MIDHAVQAPPAVAASSVHVIDLGPVRNNVGATDVNHLGSGRLNVWRNSFPSAELPRAGLFIATDVPYDFPVTAPGEPDNVVCAGQRIDVPPARYDWIYLLACSERRAEDIVYLHYVTGAVDAEALRVSDFWPGSEPRFGEVEAIRCGSIHFPRHVQARVGPRIWQQRLPVPRQEDLHYLCLPHNRAIHIFAMSAVASAGALA